MVLIDCCRAGGCGALYTGCAFVWLIDCEFVWLGDCAFCWLIGCWFLAGGVGCSAGGLFSSTGGGGRSGGLASSSNFTLCFFLGNELHLT